MTSERPPQQNRAGDINAKTFDVRRAWLTALGTNDIDLLARRLNFDGALPLHVLAKPRGGGLALQIRALVRKRAGDPGRATAGRRALPLCGLVVGRSGCGDAGPGGPPS